MLRDLVLDICALPSTDHESHAIGFVLRTSKALEDARNERSDERLDFGGALLEGCDSKIEALYRCLIWGLFNVLGEAGNKTRDTRLTIRSSSDQLLRSLKGVYQLVGEEASELNQMALMQLQDLSHWNAERILESTNACAFEIAQLSLDMGITSGSYLVGIDGTPSNQAPKPKPAQVHFSGTSEVIPFAPAPSDAGFSKLDASQNGGALFQAVRVPASSVIEPAISQEETWSFTARRDLVLVLGLKGGPRRCHALRLEMACATTSEPEVDLVGHIDSLWEVIDGRLEAIQDDPAGEKGERVFGTPFEMLADLRALIEHEGHPKCLRDCTFGLKLEDSANHTWSLRFRG